MPYIDLAFRLTGATVPVDHGYALYAALSRIIPESDTPRRAGGLMSGAASKAVTRVYNC